jgi:hypothetical protein
MRVAIATGVAGLLSLGALAAATQTIDSMATIVQASAAWRMVRKSIWSG